MILHSCGCRDVDNFVLLLANFLNCYGIHVRLDLLESKKMASAGAAVYLEATEQESKYVIIVCTKDLGKGLVMISYLNFFRSCILVKTLRYLHSNL